MYVQKQVTYAQSAHLYEEKHQYCGLYTLAGDESVAERCVCLLCVCRAFMHMRLCVCPHFYVSEHSGTLQQRFGSINRNWLSSVTVE